MCILGRPNLISSFCVAIEAGTVKRRLNPRTMKKPLWAKLELPLATTKENVWSALTLPELTQRYMYNCQLHCSWIEGSEAVWKEKQPDGSFTVHVKGTLLEYAPYSLLRFSILHQRDGLNGHTSELRFILSPHSKGVLLTVEQGDFSSFPQADEIYAECVRGWNFVREELCATCLSVQ